MIRSSNAGLTTISAWWVRTGVEMKFEAQAITERQLSGMNIIHKAQLTCFNRQKVSMTSGRGRTVITGLQPVVTENVKADNPIVRMVHWGPVLEIRAQINNDNKTVKANLRTVISEPLASDAAPAEQIASDKVDRMTFSIVSLSTNIKMPFGKPVLVGGLSSPGDKSNPEMYLVIRIDAAEEW